VKLPVIYAVIEIVAGIACMAAAGTELVSPQALAINLPEAAGLAIFGFLISTGRADSAVRRLGKFLSDDK
jgi:hypothetical protein